MADLRTTIKNWFSPPLDAITNLDLRKSTELKLKSDPYNGGTMGGLDSQQFKTWFFGLNPGEEPETLTFPIVARQGFEHNVITYKCVMTIATGIADLTYKARNKRTKKDIPNHPILDLLARPNPMQGQSSFLQHVIADYYLDGNTFIEKVGTTDNTVPTMSSTPRRLWALQPNWVQIVVGTSRIPDAYFYTAGGIESGESKRFQVDPISGEANVLHLKSYAPLREQMNGRGLSPVRSAWRQVLTHNEGARWNYALLKNSARPSGVLTAEGDLTEEQIIQLREQMGEFYGGARNSGKPAVLANGLKWQELSLSPIDMAYLEGKNSVARDICLALGVPPLLLHIPGDTTYNNVEQAKLSLYEETILPKANHLIDELNRWLCPDFDDNVELYIDVDAVQALEPRRQAKWNSVAKACGGVFLTIDEARTQMNLEPLPNGAGAVVVIPSMANTLENLIENPPGSQTPVADPTKPGADNGDADGDGNEAPNDPDNGNDVSK
jgi:HK97 family phage portal protein